MSQLDQLILDLCPNGVPVVKLGEYFTRIKGTPITAGIMKEIADEDGDVRIFAGGKTIVNAYEKDIPNANITRCPAVLVQSRGIIDFVYYDKPFTFKNEMWAYSHPEPITLKYLYYYCKNNIDYFRDAASGMGSMPQISLPVTQNFAIPLPPLPIQEKIVEILDKFSTLSAELEAELEGRRKQYEYYRALLLGFSEDKKQPLEGEKTPSSTRLLSFDTNTDSDTVQWKTLGEVSQILRGKRLTKSNLNDEGRYPVFHGGINPIGYYPQKNRDGQTVMVINVGASAGTVGFSNVDFWSSDGCFCLKKSELIIDKFLYYYLLTKENYLKSKVRYAGIPTLDGREIEQILIPIPSLERQAEIVRILDKFETLVTDLSKGLPAEIKLVQQQYEYYRNKLLTFE